MITETIRPRFNETDALGYINNTVVAQWFEGARDPVFQLFSPTLNLAKWPLILAKTVVEFHQQLRYGETVEIRTFISRIGNSSFDVYQEVWQQGQKCASGTAVIVNFNYQTNAAEKINASIHAELSKHLLPKTQMAE